MDAGRELDALVAEKVMGWVWWHNTDADLTILVPSDQSWPDKWHFASGAGNCTKPADHGAPHYSTDIADAWEVVERLRERGYYLELRGWVQVNDFMACFIMPGGKEYCITDNTAPLALCRAALAVQEG